ncbi:uncharacterized protein LOC111707445 [Eurytemora carolleeae]|uniref:uncharacterized protein LOC111707445 n=1 Tax=Eurytemora carolleeae TaxID=1294199 RepID=UPI000C78AC59|nr:uncharacterized protein LOC111707445 [Eurytemora carolleeae]|eukprot:XP_023336324.1 uncharacterized protein LOC111707445 [Eurytemora affinis]
MGKKEKEKEDKKSWRADSVICGTLCICQGLAVLSSVSIIYLSVIVYLPAKRELESGIGETPVMCTTVERRKKEHYSEACTSSSCTEWCLGKGSGPCDQIHVAVRENGTDVDFEGCSNVFRKECPILDSNTASEHNCKKNNQCTQLNGLFICQEGLCTNISEVFSCTWKREDEEDPLNCYYKRNCVKLDGEYVCTNGECSRVSGWTCRRKCEDIPMEDKNLLIMAGHSILTAHCRNGINSRNGEEIWEDSVEMENKILAASCTVLEPAFDSDLVRVTDCINGSLIPRNIFGSYSNLTSIYALYKENALRYRYDDNKDIESKPRKQHLPFDLEITIYKANDLG